MLRPALWLWPILGALSVGASGAACGHDCKAYAAAGLVVTVRAASGAPVCDATVTAIDGSYSEVLQPNGGDPSRCNYVGAYERKGTYELRATVGDATTTVASVHVGVNECHVIPARSTITLTS